MGIAQDVLEHKIINVAPFRPRAVMRLVDPKRNQPRRLLDELEQQADVIIAKATHMIPELSLIHILPQPYKIRASLSNVP